MDSLNGIYGNEEHLLGSIEPMDNLDGQVGFANGGSGSQDHSELYGRDLPNQHPITSITGLDEKLSDKADTSHTHTKSQITDFPTIPTKTSDLTNDSGFVDDSYHDNTKVDKVGGKELSTNDYTTPEKTKLAGLENYDDTDITSRVTTIESKESGWDAKLSDAPSDDKQYARKNGAWAEVDAYTTAEIDAKIGNVEASLEALL